MTNNSPVYWTANGLSLHTMAWSVKSFGGRRFFGAAKRGSDIMVPFRPGRIYMPKSREMQMLDISMWVIPKDQSGAFADPEGLSREQRAHRNWNTIVNAVDVEGQFPLIKRWYEGNQIMSAQATAEFVEGSGPDSDDGTGFTCQLTVLLADPYFYQPLTAPVAAAAASIYAAGNAKTHRILVTFPGGVDHPIIYFTDGNWLRYNGVTPGQVDIDLYNCSAKIGGTYVNGMIERNPNFPSWPSLQPGHNVGADHGGITVRYQPAYR